MNTDKPLGAGLIAFGIAGILVTLQIKVRTFNEDPGPQLFPLIGFGLLILCGLGMLLVASPARAAPEPVEAQASLVRGATMSGLFIAYSLGLWLLGYYVATPVMVYAFYHVIAGPGRRVPWQGIVYALSVTLSVHVLFGEFLNTILPQGRLF